MRAVNLLPSDEGRSGRGRPSPWVVLAAVAPVLAGSLVYMGYSVEHASVLDKKSELRAVNARLATVPGNQKNAPSLASLSAQGTQRQAALTDALSKRMDWDVTFGDLARVIPSDVWLTTLNAQSPTPADVATIPATPSSTSPPASTSTSTSTTTTSTPKAPTANPQGFTISGGASSQEAVAHLLARLSLLPALSNVTLQSTASNAGTGGPGGLQFQIAAIVNPGTGGEAP